MNNNYTSHAILLLSALLVTDLLFSVIYLSRSNSTYQPFPVEKAEAAVIFWGDDSSISKETKRRLNHALKIYKRGLVQSMICVGGNRPQLEFCGSKVMAAYLIANNIKKENVYTENRSYDTFSNWEEAYRIIDKLGFRKVTLISDQLHMNRIKKISSLKPHKWSITFSPYPNDTAFPEKSIFDLYKSIHHQWFSNLAMAVLPEKTYKKLIQTIRTKKFSMK